MDKIGKAFNERQILHISVKKFANIKLEYLTFRPFFLEFWLDSFKRFNRSIFQTF